MGFLSSFVFRPAEKTWCTMWDPQFFKALNGVNDGLFMKCETILRFLFGIVMERLVGSEFDLCLNTLSILTQDIIYEFEGVKILPEKSSVP